MHTQWGEKQNQPFQLSFNPTLKVAFQGSRVTSDWLLLAEGHLTRRRFGAMLGRIALLRIPTG